jgi:hypothetical protein
LKTCGGKSSSNNSFPMWHTGLKPPASQANRG